jgi:hypothetical protein
MVTVSKKKVDSVLRGDAPKWFTSLLNKHFEKEFMELIKKYEIIDALESSVRIVRKSLSISQHGPTRTWMDHWGLVKVSRYSHFISEPYGNVKDFEKEIQAFCKRIGCYYSIVRESEWNPPHSYRITIYEPGFIKGK